MQRICIENPWLSSILEKSKEQQKEKERNPLSAVDISLICSLRLCQVWPNSGDAFNYSIRNQLAMQAAFGWSVFKRGFIHIYSPSPCLCLIQICLLKNSCLSPRPSAAKVKKAQQYNRFFSFFSAMFISVHLDRSLTSRWA